MAKKQKRKENKFEITKSAWATVKIGHREFARRLGIPFEYVLSEIDLDAGFDNHGNRILGLCFKVETGKESKNRIAREKKFALFADEDDDEF